MESDGDDLHDLACDQVDPRHASVLRETPCIDADAFGAGIATLLRRTIAVRRFRTAEVRDVRRGAVLRDHRANGQHAQRDCAEQRAALGVETGERVVRGERDDRDAVSRRVRPSRDGCCASEKVA